MIKRTRRNKSSRGKAGRGRGTGRQVRARYDEAEVEVEDEDEDEGVEECQEDGIKGKHRLGTGWRDLSCDGGAIFRAGVQVTFFAPVSTATTARLLALVQEACDLVLRGRRRLAEGFQDGCVEIHIASDGGDAFAGLTAFDMLRRMPVPTRGLVCGSCCSAATLILLGCTERCALRHSFMLLHEVRTDVQGSCAEVRVDLANTSMLADAYQRIYELCSNMSAEQVAKEVAHEGMLSAERARELGLIHRVLGPTKVLPRGQRMSFLPAAQLW